MNTWTGKTTVKRNRVLKERRIRSKSIRDFTSRETATSRSWDETVSYELSIDLVRVGRMLAEKAARSKSGRSTAMSGAVKLRITKRVESNVEVREHPMSSTYELIEEVACS